MVDVVVAGVLTCAVGGGVATLADWLVSDAVDPCVADAVAGGVVGGLLSPLLDVVSIGSLSRTAATSLNVVGREASPSSVTAVTAVLVSVPASSPLFY